MKSIAMMRLFLFFAVLLLPFHAGAVGVQDQLNSMFGDMTNVTRPGVYEGQRRGVVTGGSFVNRSRLMQESLVGFTPPSFSAGCAGMDFNGGSFSFVNTDQFVQLLRSVAANAKGYAFQIALDAMCHECMSNIEILQKKVQKFNEMFSNSCQLAQGVVNDTAQAFGKKGLTDASLHNTVAGFGDIFGSWTNNNTAGTTPIKSLQATDPTFVANKMTGNLVWRQLINQGVNSWYALNGDMSLLEAIMSVTGSIVVQPMDPTATPPQDDYPMVYLQGNKISISDLIEGGNLTLYHCADSYDVNGCMTVVPVTVPLTGIRTLLTNFLIGDPIAGTNNITYMYATNTGTITAGQRALLTALPQGMGGMIRTLSMKNQALAQDYINQMIPGLAYDIAYTTVMSFLKTVEAIDPATKHPHDKEMTNQIREARVKVQADATAYAATHTVDTTRIIEAYNALLKASEHEMYHLARKSPGLQ